MSYRNDWHPDAFDTMQAIIRNHPDYKDYLAGALRELSQALSTNPNDTGESRGGNDRIVFVDPLVVTFRVLDADRRVRILSVRLKNLLL